MIELDHAIKDMWQDIDQSGNIRYCFTCGSCIAACPASNANPPLLIRSLIRMAVLGLEDDLLDDDTPWSCVTCSRCEEVCPMDVRPFELCLAIRKWQCQNDPTRIPPATTEVFERGYTQAVERAGKLRQSVGLTETLATIDTRPEMLEGFQNMLMLVPVIQENDYMYKRTKK